MSPKADPDAILKSAGMALAGLSSAPEAPRREATETPDEAAIMAELEALKRKPTGRKLQANFRATPRTLLRLRRAARDLRRSQADVLEEALDLFLEKYEIKD